MLRSGVVRLLAVAPQNKIHLHVVSVVVPLELRGPDAAALCQGAVGGAVVAGVHQNADDVGARGERHCDNAMRREGQSL